MKNRILNSISNIFKPIYGGIGHIFMFHRITPNPPERVQGQSTLEMHPDDFESTLLDFIQQGYQFLSMDRVHEILTEKKPAKKFIAMTFDDGYLDNYEHAWPILQKYEIPFTIYIANSFPNHTAVLWWYLLDDLILSHDKLSFIINGSQMDFTCGTPLEKQQTSLELRKHIKFADMPTFSRLLSEVFEPYNVDLHEKTRQLSMSWEQIKTINQDPLVTIGSHSYHHFTLKKLSGQQVQDEITYSKEEIESKICQSVEHFSYPFGEKNEAGIREFDAVKQAGFKTAVTTRMGSIFYNHQDFPERLPRFDIPGLFKYKTIRQAVNGYLPCRKNRFKKLNVN